VARPDAIPVDPEQARRVELLLHQLEALPTLSGVAVRLLEVTARDSPRLDDVARLVSADPSLATKLLRLCRGGPAPQVEGVTTVAAAVEHLGLEGVRSAALSVQVLEVFDAVESPGGERRDEPRTFSRAAFWQHSLATAILCEDLVELGGLPIVPAEAFTAGLLHDLGVLALHVLLPRTLDRVCRMAEASGTSLDHTCRQLVGVTPHTVGRRLAEHWRLPHLVGDVLWLHGQPAASLPDLPHRAVIALVTLADAAARAHFMAPAGHGPRGEDLAELAQAVDLAPEQVETAARRLPDRVRERAAVLGLDIDPSPQEIMLALSRANAALGRMNAASGRRARRAAELARTLEAITGFHDRAAPGGSIVAVLGKVVRSAHRTLGGAFFAMLFQARAGEPWQMMEFGPDGRLLASDVITPPDGSTAVTDLADHMQLSVQVLAMLPWLTPSLMHARDLARVRLLPLRCGWGVNAVLIHDCPVDGVRDRQQLAALSRTWAAAIAAASHHAGAKRLGEQLAEANRALMETRGELTRREKLASLGEIAAGAAHEMNNPLTVISGRAQLLASTMQREEERVMVGQIVEQSHRLSDMISALRSFAEPTRPQRRSVNLPDLIRAEMDRVYRDRPGAFAVELHVEQALSEVFLDPDMIGRVLRELLRNAVESEGSRQIVVRVQIDPLNDRLQVQVVDDGVGLSKHAQAHAFDPFFSLKSAGRQPGLGLAHARRLVEAHGGQIRLENAPSRGAVATVWLPDWRVEAPRQVA
jgi:signal transduction histidine kinase/HD-like signal output (HDOD) protein